MTDALLDMLKVIGSALVYLVIFLAPVAGLSLLAHLLLSLPLRRRERARLFLDLTETTLSLGKPLEQTLLSIAHCGDYSMGKRFHQLATHLEKGKRLGDALEAVPHLLPRQITAMLKAGERLGDLRKVVPACQQVLNDNVSQVRSAINYLLVVAFIITPFTVFVPIMLSVVVIPKFNEVFQAMLNGSSLPPFTTFVFGHIKLLCSIQAGVLSLVWIAALAYVSGPRWRQWIRRLLPGVPDRLVLLFSWRRKRLHRDFSAMLAVLLDAEVPEAEAVKLAADSTANSVLRQRATRVCALLENGVRLPEALRALDDAPELQWRLANALQRGCGFVRALLGWHEALDARAFQLEQTAAQITTSALVVFNGIVVACVVIAVFLALTNLISQVALW